MKKFVTIWVVLLLAATPVFAANFAPNVMRISAAKNIQYNFDGSTLSIPVTISGTAANLFFLVYTKDKASSVSNIKNGFLGWHYVNKIDTCVYFSGMYAMEKGSNVVKWDGKDKTGGNVPSGDYTYYMYAYDGKNPKTLVTDQLTLNYGTGTIVTNGSDGKALPQPLYYDFYGVQNKWTIGADPMDKSFLETTKLPWYAQKACFVPTDLKYFWVNATEKDTPRVAKLQWVPNGSSTVDLTWGDQGMVKWNKSGTQSGCGSDIALAGDVIVFGWYGCYTADALSELAIISQSDGSVQKKLDITDRWSRKDDYDKGAQMNGGPGQLVGRNNMVLMASFCDCYREMIDPLAENEADMVLWSNDNGDYVGDHNFEPNAKLPWVCFDFNPAPYTYTTDADANLFSTCGAYDLGAVSFILFGPDGTGIGNYAFAGETAGIKYGTLYIDNDSVYDGIYCDNNSTGATDADKKGIWYIGHDSIKGVISNKLAVSDAPSAFAVQQNVPNPFNPATTISFNLAKAGKTSVEVFNVAGQKVATLANGMLSAGVHSVTWNAADVSAGVYFYTVKSGDFSKTLKMTLVK